MPIDLFVCIDVPDLDRGVEFYAGAGLGLRLERRIDDDLAELAGASVPVQLLRQPAGSAPSVLVTGGRDYARHWTPIHLDLLVPDVEAAVAAATAAGAVLERAIERRRWNAIAGLADPFGHGFDLLEEPDSARAGVIDVAIDVSDVACAVRFYVDAFGLALRDQPMPGVWARLDGAPGTIHLQHASERRYDRHWTPVHLDFVTRDLDTGLARALAAGAALDRPIQSGAWGRMANLADPFGHGVCLVELGPRGYDALVE